MLARTTMTDVWKLGGVHADERHENTDFPSWLILLCEPNREEKSQAWLTRCKIYSYLPVFYRNCRRRGRRGYWRRCAVIPGLLFVPQVMSWIDGFDDKLKWARIRGSMKGAGGGPVHLDIADIETIMRIEAKLNKPDSPVDAKGKEIRVSARIRFIDSASERLFGEATVFEVASDRRIGVEASGLFGGKVKVYVPAAEIEVI